MQIDCALPSVSTGHFTAALGRPSDLGLLSPLHREIIDLAYYHEKSIEDGARIVGIPANIVKTRMHHARNRMAELLKDTGIELI